MARHRQCNPAYQHRVLGHPMLREITRPHRSARARTIRAPPQSLLPARNPLPIVRMTDVLVMIDGHRENDAMARVPAHATGTDVDLAIAPAIEADAPLRLADAVLVDLEVAVLADHLAPAVLAIALVSVVTIATAMVAEALASDVIVAAIAHRRPTDLVAFGAPEVDRHLGLATEIVGAAVVEQVAMVLVHLLCMDQELV